MKAKPIGLKKIKIAIVDDHQVFVNALAYILKDETDFEIVFTASNGKELIEQLSDTHVDLVLLDLDMPVMDGREALHIIRKRFRKDLKIIILSLHYSEEHVRKYMGAGADCYLSKESDHKTLVDAIRNVHEKGYFFYDKVSPKLVSELMNVETNANAVDGDPLSKREIEVISMICHGLTSHEIAKRLRLSIRTVENHRHRISKKIKARNTADIIVYAIRYGHFDIEI